MVKELALLAYLFGGAAPHHKASFELQSSAFNNNGHIPQLYTCQGKDISFPLKWHGVPHTAESLVLVMQDSSSKNRQGAVDIHWVLYNLPPKLDYLTKNNTRLARDEAFGTNSWGKNTYQGPCPTRGIHHYQIELYALNTELNLANHATIKQLRHAMQGHIVATTRLVGHYQNAKETAMARHKKHHSPHHQHS